MQVMTFQEFFHSEDVKTIDKIIGHIRRNKKAYRTLIITVAILGLFITPVFAKDKTTMAIEGLRDKALYYAKLIIYAIVLIKGLADIGGYAAHGDLKGAFKCMMQYAGIFAIFFLYPMLLEIIREAFS